jgi:hypothetical protein
MICVWQVLGDIRDFTYIADIQTCELLELCPKFILLILQKE